MVETVWLTECPGVLLITISAIVVCCVDRFSTSTDIRTMSESTVLCTIELVFNNEPRADCRFSSTLLKWALEVMRPGPRKPALAGPRLIIKYYTDSRIIFVSVIKINKPRKSGAELQPYG